MFCFVLFSKIFQCIKILCRKRGFNLGDLSFQPLVILLKGSDVYSVYVPFGLSSTHLLRQTFNFGPLWLKHVASQFPKPALSCLLWERPDEDRLLYRNSSFSFVGGQFILR